MHAGVAVLVPCSKKVFTQILWNCKEITSQKLQNLWSINSKTEKLKFEYEEATKYIMVVL